MHEGHGKIETCHASKLVQKRTGINDQQIIEGVQIMIQGIFSANGRTNNKKFIFSS